MSGAGGGAGGGGGSAGWGGAGGGGGGGSAGRGGGGARRGGGGGGRRRMVLEGVWGGDNERTVIFQCDRIRMSIDQFLGPNFNGILNFVIESHHIINRHFSNSDPNCSQFSSSINYPQLINLIQSILKFPNRIIKESTHKAIFIGSAAVPLVQFPARHNGLFCVVVVDAGSGGSHWPSVRTCFPHGQLKV